MNICLISVPISKSGIKNLKNLIKIIKNFSKDCYIITGDEGFNYSKNHEKDSVIYDLKYKSKKNILFNFIEFIKMQIIISYYILKLKNVDYFVFFFGGESLFLPALTAKIFKKKIIIVLTGFPTICNKINKNPLFHIRNFKTKLIFSLTYKIVVYSDIIIKERNLNYYKKKIHIANHHFMAFDNFKITKPYDRRENLIGYIGGLEKLKGVRNLVKAMPLILEHINLKLVMIGEGLLFDELTDFIRKNNLKNNIKLLGWIEDEEIPNYLNDFKLLILPSISEGLPLVITESMSCGTPVLATKVGAIPDVITDKENSFLIKNNSVETISQKIIDIFQEEDLEMISQKSHLTATTQFNFKTSLKQWEEIFN